MDLTIDSGAVDTVIPPQAIPPVPMSETPASTANRYYQAANNSKLPSRDWTLIHGYTEDGRPLRLESEVADATRALGSVMRRCETGNRVVFDNTGRYIEHAAT